MFKGNASLECLQYLNPKELWVSSRSVSDTKISAVSSVEVLVIEGGATVEMVTLYLKSFGGQLKGFFLIGDGDATFSDER